MPSTLKIQRLFLLLSIIGLFALGCSSAAETTDTKDMGKDTTVADTPKDVGKINTSASAIQAFLEGKILIMEGTDIPTDPNGYNENINFGAATQCYHKVTMQVSAGTYHVTSQLGTLNNAPNTGDVGTCDRATVSNELTFSSTNVLIENVATDGTCFDFTVTYPGFKQEGRGKLADDGSTLTLELYFEGQAAGHRCGDGAVGANTVTLNGNAFAGNSQQVYQVTEQ